MKTKVSKKWVKENYKNILSVGYCDVQTLFRYTSPEFYSTRVEGWACDYYIIDGVVISTGYAPIGQHIDYTVTSKYEKLSHEILFDNNIDVYSGLEKLQKQFIKECLNG